MTTMTVSVRGWLASHLETLGAMQKVRPQAGTPRIAGRAEGRMTWYDRSVRCLNTLAIPAGADAKTIDRIIRDAYPFGSRDHFPYKAWLRAVKQWKRDRARLAEFSGKA